MKPVAGTLDVAAVRAEFPGLEREVHGKQLVYLDSAATTQRCRAALEAMDAYHRRFNANVHRGLYSTSEEATAAYEAARVQVARFLGVADARQIVFTRGTTEAVNLVARSFLSPRLREGDEILVTTLEHHSNIVPWQLVAQERGARVISAGLTASHELDVDDLVRRMGPRTRMLAISHVSNVLGTVQPIERILAEARERGIVVLVDGAQAAPHLKVDIEQLDPDFYCFSGHKVFGPTGTGALYGRAGLLADMPPFFGGGDMIREVRIESSTYADPPQRFEAGTPNIAGTIGLGAAVEWFSALDIELVAAHEEQLTARLLETLGRIGGMRIFHGGGARIPVVAFDIEGQNSQDVATLLDQEAIALRSGHHCAQPLMRALGITGCLRVSLAPYNSAGDVERLGAALEKVGRVLRG